MAASRMRMWMENSGGFTGQDASPENWRQARPANRTAGGRNQLTGMTGRMRVPVVHQGSQLGQGGVTMTAPNFAERRDRGWRRGFPFRHSMWVPGVVGPGRRAIEKHGSGFRGIGNIHTQTGMRPPRSLYGLLPSQTSDWQPYRYPYSG